MKTVDTVDKSGLPMTIGGVELTEKDLRCIAVHMKHFVDVWHHGETDYFPCQKCYDTFSQEQCCPPADYDFWLLCGKLHKITGMFI